MKNILSLDAMAEWAEKMPADATYDWSDDNACACAQYARHLGLTHAWRSRDVMNRPDSFWAVADMAAMKARPHTFSNLASRLRAES